MHELTINHMDCKSQQYKEKTVTFYEMVPNFLMSSLIALSGELPNDICAFCQHKISSLAIASI